MQRKKARNTTTIKKKKQFFFTYFLNPNKHASVKRGKVCQGKMELKSINPTSKELNALASIPIQE